MASVFVNATQARRDSRNASVIHAEVRAIETVVLEQIALGELSASISSGSTMTVSVDYYNAYYNLVTDAAKIDQITYVQRYFTDLGYGVVITENPSTTNTLIWNISW